MFPTSLVRDGVEETPLILVTGGAGYVGSTLCRELLAAGYRVRVLDRLMYGGKSLLNIFNHPQFELVRGDIRDKETVRRCLKGVRAVIHLAAIVGDIPCQHDPGLSVETNYKATVLLSKVSHDAGVARFLFASTCSNYGVADTSTPADEERELNPVSLYAETKIDCERLLLQAARPDFHPTIYRFATAYGLSGRTRFDLAVNSLTYEALKEKRIMVYAANTWRPYIHVVDMSKILMDGLERPVDQVGGRVFNAGFTEENYRKRDMAEMIQDQISGLEIDVVDTIDDRRSYRVDFARLENLTGLKPTYTVKDGIREIITAFETGVLTEVDYESNRLG